MSVSACNFRYFLMLHLLTARPPFLYLNISFAACALLLTLTYTHLHTLLAVSLRDGVIIGLVTWIVYVCICMHVQAACHCSVGPAPVKDKVGII